MEQPRSFDHFDEANLDEEAKVQTPKLIKQLLAAKQLYMSKCCCLLSVCRDQVEKLLANCYLKAT